MEKMAANKNLLKFVQLSAQYVQKSQRKKRSEDHQCENHQIKGDRQIVRLAGFAIIGCVAHLAFDMGQEFWPQIAAPVGVHKSVVSCQKGA